MNLVCLVAAAVVPTSRLRLTQCLMSDKSTFMIQPLGKFVASDGHGAEPGLGLAPYRPGEGWYRRDMGLSIKVPGMVTDFVSDDLWVMII
jgi:hypothetical protein